MKINSFYPSLALVLLLITPPFAFATSDYQSKAAPVTSFTPNEEALTATPSEPKPRLANLALALGIGQLLSPMVLFWIALACFGGCPVYALALPAVGFILFGAGALWASLQALKKIKSGVYTSGKARATIGLVMGILGTGFSVLYLVLSIKAG